MPKNSKDNIFYTHLAQRIAPLNLTNSENILQQAQHVIQQDVYPAYQLLKDYFIELLANTHTNHGVWALPDGNAYYAYMLKHHTTTELSAEEIHALGLREVATIHAQMRRLLEQEDVTDTEKSIGQLLQEFSKNPAFYYPNTDAGRAQSLADYGTILERSRKELSHLFDLKPSAGVLIQRVPEHEEEGAPFAYYLPPSIYEHNFYSSPSAKIGHFQDELLRAARLVIDTGIHYKRWTCEQAVAYMQEATGYPYETAASEVERYFVLPGQACSYKIGQLKILELRQRAKDQLGSKFDIKQFHNVVLNTGAVPLTVLENVVMTYIRETLTK
jgi:uncharacterized protein (DUF885 family)